MPASSFRWLLVPALAALTLDARAQDSLAFGEATAGLGMGMRVRLQTSTGVRFTGRLASTDASSLTVVDGRGMSLRLTREQIERIDVGVPRSHTQGAIRGAAKGAAIMGIVGAVLFAIDQGTKREDGLCGDLDIGITRCTKGSDVAVYAMGGAMVGAAFGAFLPGDRWQTLRPGAVRLGVGPVPGRGIAVRAAVSF